MAPFVRPLPLRRMGPGSDETEQNCAEAGRGTLGGFWCGRSYTLNTELGGLQMSF